MRELITNREGNVHTIGDGGLDLNDWAMENMGIRDEDADAQERARLNHYGTPFMSIEDIADGEGIWEQMAFDAPDATLMADAEFEEWEAERSLMTDLEYTPTPAPIKVMNCRINGQNVTNGVQANRVVRVHELLVAVASHVLVAKHGMNAELVAMSGQEVLAVVQTACEAAVELGMTPSTIGFTSLFNQAGELQAKAEANRPKPAPSVLPPAISRTVSPTPPVKAAATVKTITRRPAGSDWAGRIETAQGLTVLCTCGCKGRVLITAAVVPSVWETKKAINVQNVGSYDLWRVARSPRHLRGIRGSTYSFEEAMEGLLETEAKLKGNNTLLRRIEDMELKDAPSFRLSSFVVEIADIDFKMITRIFEKRGRSTSDWQTLHSALGTGSDDRIRNAMKVRISVWEAREQGLTNVVDLRVLTTLCHDAAKRRADQRSWEIRQQAWQRRQQQNA